MAVSTHPAPIPVADRLLRLAIDPYAIAAVAAMVAAAMALAGEWGLAPWAALVGATAGWSSAWSP